jgi:pimeloyl-ACP methyl ester carboxylesterase
MVAVEISKFAKPLRLILISSAKGRREIPGLYRFLKFLPLYRLFPGRFYIAMTHAARPFVEPDFRREKQLFRQMTNDKDPVFMKRAVSLIVNWENRETPEDIPVFHIHGSGDRTLPLRLIRNPVVIKGGSHMMTLTEADQINKILKKLLVRQTVRNPSGSSQTVPSPSICGDLRPLSP